MFGLGVIVNSLAVVAGGVLALLLNKLIAKVVKMETIDRVSNTIMSGVALCVIYIGVSGSLECENVMGSIISMVVGGLIGEVLDLNKALNKLGEKIESKFNKGKADTNNMSISQGFISSSLLFCVGAMAVVGSLNSGLFGNNEILFAKSALDGITAFLFTLTMGFGVILSAVAIFVYEGIITVGAFLLKGLLSTPVITAMNAVGSLLILAIGINSLLKTDIKVANLLPAMFIPIFLGIFGIL